MNQQAAQAPEFQEDKQTLGPAEAVSLERYFVDTTCLKADIGTDSNYKEEEHTIFLQ